MQELPIGAITKRLLMRYELKVSAINGEHNGHKMGAKGTNFKLILFARAIKGSSELHNVTMWLISIRVIFFNVCGGFFRE